VKPQAVAVPARRSPSRRARDVLLAALRGLRIIHPFPTLLNVAATAGLAFVAAGGAPDAGVLVRMLALMLCAQSAIGVTNDLFDRELDAAAKPWKPIPSGAVGDSTAVALALVLVVTTALIGVTLGPASFALAMLGLACGLTYDAKLKRTPLSALPFMVAIPTLPLWVWVTLDEWDAVLWWLLPLGALIGLSLHLVNTLPDIDADTDNDVRGLAHRLGARRSALAAWASFGGALALAGALAPFVASERGLYAASLGLGALCLAASIGAYVVRRDDFALQLGFGVLGIGAAVVSVGWLAAVT
jgi:4-hydroxybenzoate polyprenyltransferase